MSEKNNSLLPSWIKKQLPKYLESRFFKTSHGKVHYLTSGNGDPVLFFHGNPTWSFLWRKVIAELSPNENTFYAPDLLHLGFSDSLEQEEFSMKNHCQSMVEFVEGLNLQHITVVVQDWGGPIGLYTASQFKDRIKGLVILNTGISKPTPPYKISKFHSFVKKRFWPDILFRCLGFPMYSLHTMQGDRDSIAGEVARAYRYPVRKFGRWESALLFARMVPSSEDDPALPYFDDIESFCKNFHGPIEVVWGCKDPILGKYLRKVKQVLPHANYTETNAGHFLQEECPQDIAKAILRIQSL